MRHYGDDVSSGPSRDDRRDRHRAAAARLPAARPLDAAVWAVGITILYWSPGGQREGALRHPGRVRPGSRRHGGQRRASIAMTGPARALNTVGGQVTWQATAFGAITIGLMSMFLVVRHTRAEEESGRDELLRSAAVGRARDHRRDRPRRGRRQRPRRHAGRAEPGRLPLAAADSLALGVGLAAVGLVFAGVALLAAQLTRARGGVRPDRRGHRRRLRAARHRRRRGTRADLAVPDRVVPGHARLLRAAVVAPRAAGPRARPAVDRRGGLDASAGATTAPACWPPGPGPSGRTASSVRRWALAWRLQRGVADRLDPRHAAHGAVLRLAGHRHRRPARRLGDAPQDMFVAGRG